MSELSEGVLKRIEAGLAAEARNKTVVGDLKTYKGVQYKMNQRGNYLCVEPNHPNLEGLFTTQLTLHKIIDEIEKSKVRK